MGNCNSERFMSDRDLFVGVCDIYLRFFGRDIFIRFILNLPQKLVGCGSNIIINTFFLNLDF